MYKKYIKRWLDILCAILALIIFWWLYLIIAFLVRIKLGSPVLFQQERPGKDEKIFKLYKFRSMTDKRDASGNLLPDDQRLSKFGRILRSTSMDELPEVFNILKGDMSIVGPRPERIEHVQKYTEAIPEFKYREKVKAGLTGYAQVYGKYNTTPYDKLKLDLMYIQNYSILLDLEILCKTIKTLFEKESTEGFTADEEPGSDPQEKTDSEEGNGNRRA